MARPPSFQPELAAARARPGGGARAARGSAHSPRASARTGTPWRAARSPGAVDGHLTPRVGGWPKICSDKHGRRRVLRAAAGAARRAAGSAVTGARAVRDRRGSRGAERQAGGGGGRRGRLLCCGQRRRFPGPTVRYLSMCVVLSHTSAPARPPRETQRRGGAACARHDARASVSEATEPLCARSAKFARPDPGGLPPQYRQHFWSFRLHAHFFFERERKEERERGRKRERERGRGGEKERERERRKRFCFRFHFLVIRKHK
mgnify:CR=1 FL=1